MDGLSRLLAICLVMGLLGTLWWFSKEGRSRGILGTSSFLHRLLSTFISFSPSQSVSSEHLRVIKRLHLTSSHQLHLISTGTKTLLICTHPQGCTTLREYISDDPVFLERELMAYAQTSK